MCWIPSVAFLCSRYSPKGETYQILVDLAQPSFRRSCFKTNAQKMIFYTTALRVQFHDITMLSYAEFNKTIMIEDRFYIKKKGVLTCFLVNEIC